MHLTPNLTHPTTSPPASPTHLVLERVQRVLAGAARVQRELGANVLLQYHAGGRHQVVKLAAARLLQQLRVGLACDPRGWRRQGVGRGKAGGGQNETMS